MNKKGKYLIVSPHMDDSIINCHDHIIYWKKKGIYIKIINVFTSFRSKNLSRDAKKYIKKSGFRSIKKFEKERKIEESAVQKRLNVDYENLHYTDGWFRSFNNKPIYPNQNLFKGKISSSDKKLLKDLKKRLQKFYYFDKMVIPLGVGNHVDHLIVRNVCDQTFPISKIDYYIDFPYALNAKNWKFIYFLKFLLSKKSIKFMSKEKQKAIIFYRSQLNLLYPNKINHPEIVLR
jgi:hypothetical protein